MNLSCYTPLFLFCTGLVIIYIFRNMLFHGSLLSKLPLLAAILIAGIVLPVYSQCDFAPLGPSDVNKPSNGVADRINMAIYENFVYIVYQDGNGKATVRKWDGTIWTSVGIEGFSAGSIASPMIAIDGNGTPYVVYADFPNSLKVTVKKWDGGAWTTIGAEGFSAGVATSTSLAIDATGAPYVAYTDYANDGKTTVKKWNGSSWSTIGTAGFSTGEASHPCIAIDENNIPYVVYADAANNGKATVKKWDGENWITLGSEGFSANNAGYSSIIIRGGTPYAMYLDGTKPTVQKWNGSSWINLEAAEIWGADVLNPSFTADINGTPYLVYGDYSNKVTVRKWDGSTWGIVGTITYSGEASVSESAYTSIAVDDDGKPFVAFQGIVGKAIVKKWDAGLWAVLGTEGLSQGVVYSTAIEIDDHGTPYVAFADTKIGQKATVKNWNGNSWTTVGTPGFSEGGVAGISIDFDNAGTPFIAYSERDAETGSKATVKKWNGTAWTTVGLAGISEGQVAFTSMVIDGNGVPYIAYLDVTNDSKATVKKWNGVNWINVGIPGFSAGSALYLSMALDKNDIPFVVYSDGNKGNAATVMKCEGNTWTTVGIAGFSAGYARYTSIAIDANGSPYVTFQDGANNGWATAKKWDGSNWLNVGSPGFSEEIAVLTSIKVDVSGNPYVLYLVGASSRPTVRKWDGSSWSIVGTTAFSAGGAGEGYPRFALNGSGTPYVVYSAPEAYVQALETPLPLEYTLQTANINSPYATIFKSNCELIAIVKPFGTSPVSGNITTKVWVEGVQPSKYAKRHYEIAPPVQTPMPIGTVTLYFTQQEFNDFNDDNLVKLPGGASDATGISNLRIEKRSGVSNDETGLPETYSGTIETINPADERVIWNNSAKRWEITFDVVGFSGFFVKTNNDALPVTLTNFAALETEANVVISWQTTSEKDASYFEVERSSDGKHFMKLDKVAAAGNSNGNQYYSYTDANISSQPTTLYYRLRMVDIDGSFVFSRIISISRSRPELNATIYPNPASDYVQITGLDWTNIKAIELFHSNGQRIGVLLKTESAGLSVGTLTSGLYVLKVIKSDLTETSHKFLITR